MKLGLRISPSLLLVVILAGIFTHADATTTDVLAPWGSTFARYKEYSVTSAGLDLAMPTWTQRDWNNNLVRYRLRLPASGIDPAKLAVFNPTNTRIPHQIDLGPLELDGTRQARLTFFATQPGFTYAEKIANDIAKEPAAAVYRLRYDTNTPVPTSSATFNATPSYTELANANLKVRVPAVGQTLYGSPRTLSQVPAPILQFQLKDGTWVSPSSFIGTKRQVTGLTVWQGATGPLVNEVVLRYSFVPVAPGAAPGYWKLAIRVVDGIDMVFVEEEFDFDREREPDSDRWKLDLTKTTAGPAWTFDRVTVASSNLGVDLAPLGGASKPDIFMLEGGPVPDSFGSTAGVDRAAFPSGGLTALSFNLVPWVGWDPNHPAHWSGVASSANPNRFVGLMPLFGGSWRRTPSRDADPSHEILYADGNTASLTLAVGVLAYTKPGSLLDSGGDDIALPRSTGRRQWALVLGSAKSSVDLAKLRVRYGTISLDDLKEWQLDWSGMDDLTPEQYPRVVLSPDIAATVRTRYQAGTIPPVLRAAVADTYATSGQRAQVSSIWEGLDQAINRQMDNSTTFGFFAPAGGASGRPEGFWPFTHFLAGQLYAPMVAAMDLTLAYPLNFPESGTATKRKQELRKIAGLCYLFSHPEFSQVFTAMHQGNPNMPVNRSGALGLFAALIPNHPKIDEWKRLTASFTQTQLDTTLASGGAYVEGSATYTDAGLPFIIQPLLGLVSLGAPVDPGALHQYATHFQPAVMTPPVQRYGTRVWEPYGNSSVEPVVIPAMVTAVYYQLYRNETDPAKKAAYLAQATQAAHVQAFSGNLYLGTHTKELTCVMAAYTIALGGDETQADAGSKLLPGWGASLRGRLNQGDKESLFLLRGGYMNSHSSDRELGSFVFHTAGDEFLGFPDNGYIEYQTSWGASSGPNGSPWSTIGGEIGGGEVSDVGLTSLADYAIYRANRTKSGYTTNAWIRQAVLVKGSANTEYDYVILRDSRPAGDPLQSLVLATRVSKNNWSAWDPTHRRVDLTGRAGVGKARIQILGLNGSLGTPYIRSVDNYETNNPLWPLTQRVGGSVESAKIYMNSNGSGFSDTGVTDHFHSSFTIPTGNATTATWAIQGGSVAAITFSTLTTLADGVVKVTSPLGSDYVFLREGPFATGVITDGGATLAFTGTSGVIRVRGTTLTLTLNAGIGSIRYNGCTLTGTGPIEKTTTTTDSSTYNIAPATLPSAAILSGSGVTTQSLYNANGATVTKLVDAANRSTQYLVNSPGGAPVTFANDEITARGIVNGSITISPFKTTFTVTAGGGTLATRDYGVVGEGPYTVSRSDESVTGVIAGSPRTLWVPYSPGQLRINGVASYAGYYDGFSVGAIAPGNNTFEFTSADLRRKAVPALTYTLDRLPVRTQATAPVYDSDQKVFRGVGSWTDAANWSGATLPVAGDHVIIGEGATIIVTDATPLLRYLRVDGTVRTIGLSAVIRANTVEINGTLTHDRNFSQLTKDSQLAISCGDLLLNSAGRIDVTGKGYPGNTGKGSGPGISNPPYGWPNGGSHGGAGGLVDDSNNRTPGPTYDDPVNPVEPGSSGAANRDIGGAGGGVVRIVASGQVTLNGIIFANGETIISGCGAGGSVNIQSRTITGTGAIYADGGNSRDTKDAGGGGGGGRVSLRFDASAQAALSTQPALRLSVAGGPGSTASRTGSPGSLHLTNASFYPRDVITDEWIMSVDQPGPIIRDRLLVRDARISLPAGCPLVIASDFDIARSVVSTTGSDLTAGRLLVNEGSVLTLIPSLGYEPDGVTPKKFSQNVTVYGDLNVSGGSRIQPKSHPTSGSSVAFTARNITITSDSQIDATGAGYAGGKTGLRGNGPGGGGNERGGFGGGGSYGGRGGNGYDGNLTGIAGATYGNTNLPDQPGSGGGVGGSAGGGLISLVVYDTLTLNGKLGTDAGFAQGGAGGSGGAIALTVKNLVGNGTLSAKGGSSGIGAPAGVGGGGRIAVHYQTKTWSGTPADAANLTPVARGSNGSTQGGASAGTVVFAADASLTPPPAFTGDSIPPATPDTPTVSGADSPSPAFQGATEPGNTVTIYEDGVPISSVIVGPDGQWSWSPSAALAYGSHTFTFTYTDPAGNVSGVSAPSTLVILPEGAAAPAIVSGPVDLTVDLGFAASFSATVTGSPAPALQWQRSNNAGLTWNDIPAANSNVFTIPATTATDNNARFRVVATNVVATNASQPARLQVNGPPLQPTNQPPSVTLLAPGDGASFYPPGAFNLTANAVDADGSIASVVYFLDGFLLGESFSSPYAYAVSDLAVGTYTLEAVAIDNQGAISASAFATVAVKLPDNSTVAPVSLFATSIPAISTDTDDYELGLRFKVLQSGFISALRYWKPATATGTHTGRLWSATGTLLASAIFTGETSSGWQQVDLPAPVEVTANDTFVVSVNVNPGENYAYKNGDLASALTQGMLQALAGGGVYNGSPGAYPTLSFQNSNYFRDVVFFPLSTYALWKVNSNIALSNAGDLADPDDDGLVNLLEYALGLDPLDASSAAATTTSLEDGTGKLTLTFLRAAPANEVTYQVYGSSDLVTWSKVGPANPGTVGQNVTVIDEPPTGATRRFLRLEINGPDTQLPELPPQGL